jgi:osmoprotectant transport system substrate-binding protein
MTRSGRSGAGDDVAHADRIRSPRETARVHRVRVSAILVLLCGLCAWTACSGAGTQIADPSPDDGVRIASFDFVESELLAELYAQVLEAADIPVIRLGVVGPREIVAPALELDRVDLVPEYLGTALRYFGDTADPDVVDSTQSSSRALQQLLTPRGLVVLDAAAAQNSNAIVVTSEFAAEGNIVTISDLTERSTELRLGGPVECPDRPLCLLGLSEVYGLEFAEFVPQQSVALTVEALRRDEIEVGVAFTTSPELDDDAFTVLDDDRGLQPSENVVPMIRRSALDRWGPQLDNALNAFSATLTTDQLRAMNRRVADETSPAEIAAAWLADNT